MKPLLLTLNLLCGADAASTHAILTHGGTERLLPTQNVWAIDAAVAGEAAGTSLIGAWLDRQRHPKIARAFLWGAIGVRAYAVTHNIRELTRRPR
jgi:hypothetical protein